MILNLAFKYFILNKKRTVKAAQVIALGLILVVSSNLLIGGFTSEIVEITSKLGRDDRFVVITPLNGEEFSQVEILTLDSYLNISNQFSYSNYEHFSFTNLFIVGSDPLEVPLHITNITKIIEHNNLNLGSNFPSVLFTSDLQINLQLQENQFINVEIAGNSRIESIDGFISPNLDGVNSGIYFHQDLINDSNINPNLFFAGIKENVDLDQVLDRLTQLDVGKVGIFRGEPTFLDKSARQISNTIQALQIAISFLVFISIWNLMNVIVLESRKDIRVLQSIGYSNIKIIMMFLTISALIGLLGFILTLLISLVLVYAILSIISGVLGLPFVIVSTPLGTISVIFLNSTFIAMFSSILPSIRSTSIYD